MKRSGPRTVKDWIAESADMLEMHYLAGYNLVELMTGGLKHHARTHLVLAENSDSQSVL